MSARVFISYGKEDYETAKRLYDDLKTAGFPPWMDRENILVGQNRKLEIRQAIQESSYFLILLSEKSLSERGYFQKELKTALEILEEMPPSEIFILPVRLDACKPVYENLQDIQRTDLFSSYDEGFRQIVHALKSPGGERESRRFVSKRVLEKLAGIVKDSQAGVVGDSVKIEGGIHQHILKAEKAQGPVQVEKVERFEQHFYQDARLWIVFFVLVCLFSVWIIFGRPENPVKQEHKAPILINEIITENK